MGVLSYPLTIATLMHFNDTSAYFHGIGRVCFFVPGEICAGLNRTKLASWVKSTFLLCT